ncbi:MAG: tetratricopeptide repeat protein [Bdellovibrionota bacterium]
MKIHKIPQFSFPNATILAISLILISCISINTEETRKKDELIKAQLKVVSVRLNNGEPEKALQTLKYLQSNFPNNYSILTIHGMTHLTLENPGQAIHYLKRAYEQQPTAASGLNLSSALIANQEAGKARMLLFKLIKEEKSYRYKERLIHNIALSYLKESKLKAAEKYFQNAIDINPTYYMSLIELAKIYDSKKDNTKAIQYLEKAARACSTCYEPTNLLATKYIDLRETKKAIKILEKFVHNQDNAIADQESATNYLKLLKKQPQSSTQVKISKQNSGQKKPVSSR